MSRSFKDTTGGKQISGGTLSPRTKKVNSALAVDSWRRGGGSTPVAVQYLVIGGGGGGGTGDSPHGNGGGGGGSGGHVTGTFSEVIKGTAYSISIGGGGGEGGYGTATNFVGPTTVTSNRGNPGSGGGPGYSGSGGASGRKASRGQDRHDQ